MSKRGECCIDLEKLKILYIDEGLSGRECAKILGCGKSTAFKYIKELGLSRPNIQYTDAYGRFIKEGQELPPLEGKGSPRWKDGSKSRTYRRIAFKHHPNECYHCKTKDNLEVHHINRNRKDNKPRNLRIVCQNCHRLIEHKDLYDTPKERDELGRFKPNMKGE